ncbi:MAG: hypothetical protein QOF73_4979 [Thermomicrobiales bacterium]|jgi:photosystem II stability/assembly factor-like uncharacterized protein|nr:hypothetical protein [Thermomicrobiales bacterium]
MAMLCGVPLFRGQMIPSLRQADAASVWCHGKTLGRGATSVVVALLLMYGTAIGRSSASSAAPMLQATPVVFGALVVDGDPIVSLVPTPPDASAIYAIGKEGLYRTDDGAESWRRVGPLPPTGHVVAAVDDPLLLLAGNRPACARAEGDNLPLNRSEDGGATWQEVPGLVDAQPLAIWRGASLALAASCSGLQLSTDAGKTWRAAPLTDPNYDISSFAVVSGTDQSRRTALVGATSEGGTNRIWLLDLSDPSQPTSDGILADLFGLDGLAGHDRLYLAGVANGVLISTDEGDTWRRSRRGLEEVTVSVDPLTDVIPKAERGRGITAVALDPTQPNHLYAGTGDGLYESLDEGDSWHRVPGVEGRIDELVLAPGGGRLLVQTDAGVFVLVVS